MEINTRQVDWVYIKLRMDFLKHFLEWSSYNTQYAHSGELRLTWETRAAAGGVVKSRLLSQDSF